MNKIYSILIASLVTLSATGQSSLQWYFSSMGSQHANIDYLGQFSNGDIFVYGENNKGDLDPDSGINKSSKEFFARYSIKGQLIFARPLFYKGYSKLYNNVALDNQGNIFTSVLCEGKVDFDSISNNGIGEFNFTNEGMAIVKLDAMGNFLWAKFYDSGLSFLCLHLTVDSKSNLFISGSIENEHTFDFDPDTGISTYVLDYRKEAVIIKFDSNGVFQNVYNFNTPNNNVGFGSGVWNIFCDSLDNILVHFIINGTVDIDPGISTNTISLGGYDFAIVKYNNAMQVLHKIVMPGVNIYSLTFDKWNNFYATGVNSSATVLDIDPGPQIKNIPPNSCYFVKFNNSGQLLWARYLTTATVLSPFCHQLQYFSSENYIYATITIRDSIMLNGLGLPAIPNNSTNALGSYFVKMDTAGNANTVLPLSIYSEFAYDKIFIPSSNHFLYTGTFDKTYDIEIGPGITALTTQAGWFWTEFFLSYYNFESSYNMITGKVYDDANSNGIKDSNEVGIENAILEIQPGNYFISTDNYGNFTKYVPPGSYTITINDVNSCYTLASPSSHTAKFSTYNQHDSLNDFKFTSGAAVQDLSIKYTLLSQSSPGFNFYTCLNALNLGCNISDPTIKLFIDSQCTFIQSSPMPDSIIANTLIWHLNNFAPNKLQPIHIELRYNGQK